MGEVMMPRRGSGGLKMEMGSYVGTGTYGKNNPNSLTFSFDPKFVYLCMESFGPDFHGMIFQITEDKKVLPFSISSKSSLYPKYLQVSISGKTITWYTTASGGSESYYQLNGEKNTTYYTAIGI